MVPTHILFATRVCTGSDWSSASSRGPIPLFRLFFPNLLALTNDIETLCKSYPHLIITPTVPITSNNALIIAPTILIIAPTVLIMAPPMLIIAPIVLMIGPHCANNNINYANFSTNFAITKNIPNCANHSIKCAYHILSSANRESTGANLSGA